MIRNVPFSSGTLDACAPLPNILSEKNMKPENPRYEQIEKDKTWIYVFRRSWLLILNKKGVCIITSSILIFTKKTPWKLNNFWKHGASYRKTILNKMGGRTPKVWWSVAHRIPWENGVFTYTYS